MGIVNSRIGLQVQTHQPDLINIYDSVIGDNTRIGTFTEIGGANVGHGCDLSSYVKLSKGCEIGDSVVVGHNTVVMSYAKIGNNVRIGNCCVLVSNITVGDNSTIDDGVYLNRDVGPGERVKREAMSSCSPRSRLYENINPEPAISSDHPIRKFRGGAEISRKDTESIKDFPRCSQTEELVQLSFEDLFEIAEKGLLNKVHACKGRCMEEPKSEDSDLVGLGIRQ